MRKKRERERENNAHRFFLRPIYTREFPPGNVSLHCREREAGTTTYQNFLIDVVHGPADDKYECICHGGVNRKIFNG